MKDKSFYKGSFGLERETLRVDRDGKLAQTPHPFGDSEEITRDFCENQIELVTPVCTGIDALMSELRRLDGKIKAELDKNGERIWLYSNPPHIENENDIPVANFIGEHSGKRRYRDQLERRYGKRLMLFSGIHFNFSFDDEYLRSICDDEDFESFKNRFYLRLYKQLSVHSWLVLLLTAVSPIYDKSLDEDGAFGAVKSRYASMRSSERGYWNEFVPELKFGDLSEFVDSIQYYVDKGALFSASELYLPVRLKPKGVNKLESFKNGVSHIELRMFDIDPFTELGVDEKDLEFAHLLIMYLSTKEDFDLTAELQQKAVTAHKNAALYDLDGIVVDGVPILERAEQIINDMLAFFSDDNDACGILIYEKNKLDDRLCKRLTAEEVYG
ncbi:MAG: glutathione synthase [Ruminococcus sp.]|nr:glutathione synthase [Ruminococcus sp.]